MSKLISEEIVEAITLGDKEGFMSAFQSALAAKVSDALEIKKVEIASTLIAPASSEVVEEEVEQIDELKQSTLDSYGDKRHYQILDRKKNGTEFKKPINLMKKSLTAAANRANAFDAGKLGAEGSNDAIFDKIRKKGSNKVLNRGTAIEKIYHNKGVGYANAQKALKSKYGVSEEVELDESRAAEKLMDRLDFDSDSYHENNLKHIAIAPTAHLKYLLKYNMGRSGGGDHPMIPHIKKELAKRSMKKEEVEEIDEGTPEAKGQSRLAWRMDTAHVIAKNHAKIAAKKKAAQKKLLSGKGK